MVRLFGRFSRAGQGKSGGLKSKLLFTLRNEIQSNSIPAKESRIENKKRNVIVFRSD